MTETLVVVSKLKKYIKDKSGMSTSATAIDELTRLIQKACDEAIEKAKASNRKTVMDRDFFAE
jgi:histone H3/H4